MATYTRIYADSEGASHFEEVEIAFSPIDYSPPSEPLGLSEFAAGNAVRFMNAPAGWSSDWHPSAARNLFLVLSGEWEVTAGDGETRRFGAGTVLLVEDTHGRGHKSRVLSNADSLAAMIELR